MLWLLLVMVPVASVLVSPRLVSLMNKEAERKEKIAREKQKIRDGENAAKRPGMAEVAALRSERQANLDMTESEKASVRAAFDETMAALDRRSFEQSVLVKESTDAYAFLLNTIREPFRSTRLHFESLLDSAKSAASERAPEAYKSANTMQVALPGIEHSEGQAAAADRCYQTDVAEYAESVAEANATIKRLSPVVEKLKALCLTADPSEESLAAIVAGLEV